jgi:hypothetical protein
MTNSFPDIEDVEAKDKPIENERPNVVLHCEKHGEIREEYVFRVNMPDHGYDRKMYCLVCAIDYLSMIASEVQIVPVEETNNE